MNYEDALAKWGSEKLCGNVTDVSVTMEARTEIEGYCSTCYFEYEVPYVHVTARDENGKLVSADFDDLSLDEILREILEGSD